MHTITIYTLYTIFLPFNTYILCITYCINTYYYIPGPLARGALAPLAAAVAASVRDVYAYICMCVYIYIYIHTYIM